MENIISSIVIILALSFSGAAHAQQGAAKPTGVYVSAVKQLELVDKVESLGSLRANEAVSLASTVTELVTEINFVGGQRVKQGDLLVKLDVSEELAQQAEEQARFQRAKQQVERFKPLIDRGAASQAALDDARSEMKVAEARINAIKSLIAQRNVVAPFDGVVGLRNISVTVSNRIVATTSAFPGKVYHGTVEAIDSRVNASTRAITVRAKIPNSDFSLKPGLLMRVTLDRNPRQALVVQEEAVTPNGSKTFVLLATPDNGQYKAQRREVFLGARQKGEVEVLSGLELGDLVITHGGIKVSDGSLITILAEEKDNETLSELLKQPTSDASNVQEAGTSNQLKRDQASTANSAQPNTIVSR